METKKIPFQESKKGKLFLFLPLLILPFITLLFHVLGGGRQEEAMVEKEHNKGFNFNLPIPEFKEDSAFDKMSYYDKAATDSLKLLEAIKKDPNYSNAEIPTEPGEVFAGEDFERQLFPKGRPAFNSAALQQGNERKVYEKIKALEKIISQPAGTDSYGQDMGEFENYGSSDEASQEIRKAEQLMSSIGEAQHPDPELQQLGGMLENILDIQHPARVQERLKQSSDNRKGKIYAVTLKKEMDNTTLLGPGTGITTIPKGNSFFAGDETPEPEYQPNSIEAVIHETQSIVNGSVVKLRLRTAVMLQGTLIPKNTFLYGTASLKGERLEIKVDNIRYRNSIFPVQLTIYDLDGIDGIYIPGAINRDVAKASADRSIQTLGLTGVTDSWGAQAAGMGIEAAKSLMSKKVKLVQVVVKAGYQVLLYDEKQKDLK